MINQSDSGDSSRNSSPDFVPTLPTIGPMTATTEVQAPTFGNFINGEWREAESGRTFESHNPADTRDLIGHFAQSDASDVAAAIRAAEDALPGWRSTPAPKR